MLDSIYFHLTIKLFLGFTVMLISVKIIGKRQFQQVSPFDFISAIVFGEFLGNAIYDNDITVFHILYSIAVWTLLIYIIEKLSQKSFGFRRVVEGSPVLIIKKGKIDYQVMKKERLDFVELLSLLRDRGACSVSEVEYAVLEHNGMISVIKKSQYNQVTKGDMKIDTQAADLPLPLIIEGKVLMKNLQRTGHDEHWLNHELSQSKVHHLQDVLYAEWGAAIGLHVQQKQ